MRQTKEQEKEQLIGICCDWLTSNLSHFVFLFECCCRMGIFGEERAITRLEM